MGRQISFYMLPSDLDEFFKFVQRSSDVVICARSSETRKVEAIDPERPERGGTICLWNLAFLSDLEREWVPDPGYFRIDTLRKPVLEVSPSLATTWEGHPALVQGRLYGQFDDYLKKPAQFSKWYDTLVRWIRKHYQSSSKGFGGYLAPSALQFIRDGGYLLPGFVPPRTQEWLDEIQRNNASTV